ncbi:uncharacterized protein BDZ99DRAFT_492828 [Mytilinidion resinicola]|uniref:Nucleoporin NUP188 n=1 Tax=Mytilinidion resinicola TaxID=574789 RepID=A0A6A6Z861_9PEZI|nr:uncharacterized protein BDZ99DRAFT_492828 [Mytilinidion resinicola]KAF2816899.1 hypothetical protein BDZ99DRAFT_492828 [Mytilinidion resinicola]
MAPIETPEVFFPSLAECFSGEKHLLSWKAVYAALCDPGTVDQNQVLRSFLTDRTSVLILSHPLAPYKGPSSGAKGKFETETAAINVTPSPNGHYKIDEIKEDALWLSGVAQIDEVSALRTVVLEWQIRPTLQLLNGFTEEEAISVQDAAGSSNLGASTFWANSSILAAPVGANAQSASLFNSREQRQLRLLDLHLSEKAHILRVSQILICRAAPEDLRSIKHTQQRSSSGKTTSKRTWVEEVGETILQLQRKARESASPQQDPLIAYVDAIQSRMEAMGQGSKWEIPESIQPTAEEKWNTYQVVEIVHILHLLFIHVDIFTENLPTGDAALKWFRFMDTWSFFAQIPFNLPGQISLIPLMQLFVATISLAILKIPQALEHLESERFGLDGSSAYISQPGCLRELSGIFRATELPSPASPVILAWGTLGYALRCLVGDIVYERENRIASEGVDLLSGTSPLEDAGTAIDDRENLDDSPTTQSLAEYAANTGVCSLIAELAQMVTSTFGTSTDILTADRQRKTLLDLFRACLGLKLVRYSPDVIWATLAIMSPRQTSWDWLESGPGTRRDPIVDFVLADVDVLSPSLILESQYRYPYETVPLMKFCSVIAQSLQGDALRRDIIGPLLTKVTNFSQSMRKHFDDYESIREEMNENWVALKSDLPLFQKIRTKQRRITASSQPQDHVPIEDEMYIPQGTAGQVVDNSVQPFVASWQYHHSALKYLAVLLSTFMTGASYVEHATEDRTSLDNASEIIGLFADLLDCSIKVAGTSGDGQELSEALLENLNIKSDRTEDTVSVVFAIFEQELQHQCEQPGVEGSLDLLVNCTHFIHAMVSISPDRVWPWLARSRLLEVGTSGGSLAKILVGSEIVLGHYDFLLGCIRLFQALVEDAITQCVKRKSSKKAVTRFGSAPSISGTSEKSMSSTLLIFGRTLTGIFEGSSSWRYIQIDQKLGINILLSNVFETILEYVYGFDNDDKLSEVEEEKPPLNDKKFLQKLVVVLEPIAEYLVDLFLSTSENDLPTNPIISVFIATSDIQPTSILTKANKTWSRQTRSALQFSNTLIRIGMQLGRTGTHFEHQLFKAAPLLARLYAIDEVYRSPVVILLESLVRSAAQTDGEPPSLLGHLGPGTAKCFLQIVSTLDQPFKTAEVEIDIWRLLSAVVSCKQQWLAIYLLTGNTPKESLKHEGTAASNTRGKALFTLALDELSQVDVSNPRRTIAMLEFVILAQNTWPWAMSSLRGHQKIVPGLLAFLKTLRTQEIRNETEIRIIEKSNENKIAALITEFLAMYLHIARQLGDMSSLSNIIAGLGYLENCGVSVPTYNASLHANLKNNLKKKFEGTGVYLICFKKTELMPSEFGRDFFYDIAFAEKLLGFDASWKNGYEAEFRTANANLSLVESQILLLKGWKLLASELSNFVTKDKRLERTLITVARDCLEANADSCIPEQLFGRLMTLRVEFAFVLIQKLANAKIQDEAAKKLFITVWKAVIAMRPNFETALVDKQSDYYRSLLKVLFLSLRFLLPTSASPEIPDLRKSMARTGTRHHNALVNDVPQTLLEILAESVAKGFHGLANQLHEDKDSCSPSDFVLLTGLLQTILGLPEMRLHQSEAALLFQNHNTSRYATSLFSWSDQLAKDRDPIYGELSILFLLELSSMPIMAENLAVDGVLSRLNAANIINYYRRPHGMGPFDDPPRLFSIWTRGILPLCLNLLDAVGAPIAAEVATFLNQFPTQLARASACLNSRNAPTAANPNAGRITLGMASEAHSLALITLVLDQLRESAATVGIIASDVPELEWDKAIVKEDIEEWMAGRRGLRDRIAPTNEREVALAGIRSQREGAENVLEERVVAEFEAAVECLGGSSS